MRQLFAKISSVVLVTLLVVTSTAMGGVSSSGVPAGIQFVGSNCCDKQSDDNDAQRAERSTKLERACCCRPTPFAEMLLSSSPAISADDERRLLNLVWASVQMRALLGLALDAPAASPKRARAPPPLATSLYTQHTSLLL